MEQDFRTVSKLLFPDEKELNKTPEQKFDDQIREKVFNMRKQSWSRLYPNLASELKNEEDYKKIADFIRKHVETVGRGQAMKDLQTGLNLLHKHFKYNLKEDGDYREKTHSALEEALKFYSLRAIKIYIRRGIINNLIFETKNNPQIDTNTKVNKIGRELTIKSRV